MTDAVRARRDATIAKMVAAIPKNPSRSEIRALLILVWHEGAVAAIERMGQKVDEERDDEPWTPSRDPGREDFHSDG